MLTFPCTPPKIIMDNSLTKLESMPYGKVIFQNTSQNQPINSGQEKLYIGKTRKLYFGKYAKKASEWLRMFCYWKNKFGIHFQRTNSGVMLFRERELLKNPV